MPPAVPYADIRPWLTTGTVILWKGSDLLSRAIRLFSEFSHASLVVRDIDPANQDRVHIIEALATGLEMRHLSSRIRGYNGRVFAFKPFGLGEETKVSIKSFALDECAKGVRYDYGSLFANALGRVSEEANRWFCSEFAAKALEQAGICRIPLFRDAGAARPGDIPEWFMGRLREIEVA
jgi:hypothetical protein